MKYRGVRIYGREKQKQEQKCASEQQHKANFLDFTAKNSWQAKKFVSLNHEL